MTITAHFAAFLNSDDYKNIPNKPSRLRNYPKRFKRGEMKPKLMLEVMYEYGWVELVTKKSK